MSDSKELAYWMGRALDLERRNITLENQNKSLRSIVENDIQIITRLRDSNRRLSACLSGETDAVKLEIDRMIKSIGGC